MENKMSLILDEAALAFNSRNLSKFTLFFDETLDLISYPRETMASDRLQARKLLDRWLQQYPVTQIELINQMAIGSRLVAQIRILKYPEEPPFDIVLMIATNGKQINKIDLILTELNDLTTIL